MTQAPQCLDNYINPRAFAWTMAPTLYIFEPLTQPLELSILVFSKTVSWNILIVRPSEQPCQLDQSYRTTSTLAGQNIAWWARQSVQQTFLHPVRSIMILKAYHLVGYDPIDVFLIFTTDLPIL
jgi:hypothetical protein